MVRNAGLSYRSVRSKWVFYCFSVHDFHCLEFLLLELCREKPGDMQNIFAKRMTYPIQIGTLESYNLEIYLCLIFVLDNYEILLSQYKYPNDRSMYKYFSGNQIQLF